MLIIGRACTPMAGDGAAHAGTRNVSPTPTHPLSVHSASNTECDNDFDGENTAHLYTAQQCTLLDFAHDCCARTWMRDRWPDAPCRDDSDDVLRS